MNARLLVQIALPFVFAIPACTCDDPLAELKASVGVVPETLDFGRVPLGGAKELVLTVRNKGALPIQIEGFATDAPFVAPAGTSSIATGGVTKRRITFAPAALGPATGTLHVTTDVNGGSVLDVPLAGEGIQAAVKVDPAVVDFGEVLWVANGQPERRTVTVSNPGTDAFELTALELTDDAGGQLTIDPIDAKKTYAPSATGTFAVVLTPHARGVVSGQVVVHTTAPEGAAIEVPIHGSLVGPVLQLCEQADGQAEACVENGVRPKLSLLTERTGTAHGTIRARNIGDRDLTIAGVLVTGQATEMALSPAAGTSPVVIQPGQSSTWEVTYTPQDYTFDTIIVSFASNSSSGGVESMRVDGDVLRPDLQVVPHGLTFHLTGQVHEGHTHVQLFNCGTSMLTLGAITLSEDSGTSAFSLLAVPSAGTQIAPQPACSAGPEGAGFDVQFSTTTHGNYAGTVSITSDDPVHPVVTVTAEATKD